MQQTYLYNTEQNYIVDVIPTHTMFNDIMVYSWYIHLCRYIKCDMPFFHTISYVRRMESLLYVYIMNVEFNVHFSVISTHCNDIHLITTTHFSFDREVWSVIDSFRYFSLSFLGRKSFDLCTHVNNNHDDDFHFIFEFSGLHMRNNGEKSFVTINTKCW